MPDPPHAHSPGPRNIVAPRLSGSDVSDSSTGPRKHQIPDISDAIQPLSKKAKTVDPEHRLLTAAGKVFARQYDAFIKFDTTVMYAAYVYSLLEGNIDAPISHANDEARAKWRNWEHLRTICHDAEDLLIEADVSRRNALVKTLNDAVSQARFDDTSKMKKNICHLLWDYDGTRDLTARKRSNRGFQHPVTGAFLCPITMNWHDNSNESEATMLRNRKLRPSAMDWPHFLYPTADEHNPDALEPGSLRRPPTWEGITSRDVWNGFCKSHILVQTWDLIYTGTTFTDQDMGGKAGKRVPNSLISQVSQVTTESIAWAAVMLRHALSTEDEFSANPTGLDFPGRQFYRELLRVLNRPESAAETRALLAWWNSSFFPERQVTATSGGGAVALFDAYREDTHASAADSTT